MDITTSSAQRLDWTEQLVEQLDWHWRNQLRPRLDGLTDEEYLWEPVDGAWSIRPRGTATTPMAGGSGEFTIDFALPEPDPAPITTIAWRLGHIIVGVLGARVANHFGGTPVDYFTHDYAGDAATALTQLDHFYAAWMAGVRGLDEEGLSRPCGPAEGQWTPEWAEYPMATLVLHINREVLHHGAEIALLRDLYRWRER
ncbi:MAG: DinB family protein [Kutzneria sp.]|nr:DinB family protein [Kutzneria sp.]MBV9847220.1 DinB family protein [Kutzneria sp.]